VTRVPFNPRIGSHSDQGVIRLMGGRGFAFGQRGLRDDQMTPEVKEARKNRHVNGKLSRTAASGSGGGFGDIQFATGRPRDPLFYWRQNNLPYDFSENEELAKVRSFCRLLYQTDPIIGSCVDIFSKFPVLGHELRCKDEKLTEFYTEQFFDEDHLDYEEFLVDIGREYWTVGEAWPFATFNEDLGIWDDEELLNPDDVKVERSPFLKEPRYFIRLPWTIRQVLQTRQPAWEYNKLIQEYPELVAYTSENSFMPVSSVLMQQLRFKGDTFNVRGVPLLTRAMRPMLQQEMLNTALDSIADRLYTPLILCKLGASATDLGTSVPWIPTDDDLESFELALDAALAGDFRALIHNFAIEIEQVFGKENMPDLTPDFERIEDRVLQVFGLSRTFLMGAQGGQTYAADALNKELVTQLMTRYQKYLVRHFRKRALIVAEAQEHYDYEERAGKRYVVMEEVLEEDEETGGKRITEQPRLLIPDLLFKTLNFKDEDLVRQFTEALRETGVPVSMRTRTRNLDFDLDEEVQRSQDEAVQLAVAEQETRKQTFIALRDGGYPVPPDLMADFAPMAQLEEVPPALAAQMIMAPRLGTDPLELPDLAPTAEDMMLGGEGEEEPPPGEGGDPFAPDQDDGESQVPGESSDERGGMPVPGGGKTQVHAMRRVTGSDGTGTWDGTRAHGQAEGLRHGTEDDGAAQGGHREDGAVAPRALRRVISDAALFRRTARVREAVITASDQGAQDAPDLHEFTAHRETERSEPFLAGPAPAYARTPRHVGMRSRLGVSGDEMDGELYP
jgi:hypothetical protein